PRSQSLRLTPSHWNCSLISRRCRTPLTNIIGDDLLPFSLNLENKFDRVTQSAIPARVLCHIVSVAFDFIARIGDGYSQAAIPHHWQINDVVTDKTSFSSGNFLAFQNFLK